MLTFAIVLLIVLLLLVIALFLRKAPVAAQTLPDPRQLQLPDQMLQLHARHEGLDTNLRTGLSELRRDAAADALATRETHTRATGDLRAELAVTLDRLREDNALAASGLRQEVLGNLDTLGKTLKAELASFRQDNTDSARKLHTDVHTQHEAIQHKLGTAATEARQLQDAARELLDSRMTQLTASNTAHHERMGTTVSERLDKLNAANTAKLEEMRATVDEKLHATLHTRLTESFGQVTDQLNKVHTGLGEMSKLSRRRRRPVADLYQRQKPWRLCGGAARHAAGADAGAQPVCAQRAREAEYVGGGGVRGALPRPLRRDAAADRREVSARGLGAAGKRLCG